MLKEAVKLVLMSGCSVEYFYKGSKLTICYLYNYVPEQGSHCYQVHCDHNDDKLRSSTIYPKIEDAIKQFLYLKMEIDR